MIFKRHKKLCLSIGCVLLALLVLAMVCLGIFFRLGSRLESQQAAERFQGESQERFAQVSAYFPATGGVTEQDIWTFRQTVDQKLLDVSLEAEGSEALYADAYSAQGEIAVEGSRGRATAPVIAVGGDFFLFHPLQLRCGSYISQSDLMHDRVVLDEELAWKLFGGVELAGLTVEINGEPYVIAGVVQREKDSASEEAYTLGGGLYMHYDRFNAIKETKISCYELVCANPISGFALDIVKERFAAADCVENSARFKIEQCAENVINFGSRTLKTDGVIHPYWESAARMMENRQAAALVLFVIFIILPLIGAIAAIVILLKAAKGKIRRELPEQMEKFSQRRWEKRAAKEE
ncbi:MAG: ABC transporter permease [Oscillospiraceae bacterium]|nr:ABC transporter permease [Oscillospiraceae bacterium]